jgi:CheY-like chemotaxis protein/HPt (histidine-containing phosphotransfer) domain-containing protein
MQCRGIKALVVDDEPMNLIVAKGIFRSYGMEVTTVSSGQESIDICRERRFDIVFMDHMMPGMDGIEAMKAIRADRHAESRDMPIVALTANAVSTAKEMFMAAGFDGFVSKPVEITELERVLKRVLPKTAVTYENVPGAAESENNIEEGSAGISDKGTDRSGEAENENGSHTGDIANTGNNRDNAEKGDIRRDILTEAGIDEEAGLKYSQNDRELYETILKQYVKEAPVKREKISLCFEEGDYKNYEVYVHALKSTSRMIGASELSERAKELEDLAKKGGARITEEMQDELMSQYEKAVNAIAGMFGLDTGSASEPAEKSSSSEQITEAIEFGPADRDENDDSFVLEFEPKPEGGEA